VLGGFVRDFVSSLPGQDRCRLASCFNARRRWTRNALPPELRMPSLSPASPDDRDIYLVLEDFGEELGRAWPEVDEARTDREILVADLLRGEYFHPVRIVAFNTWNGWARDVSEEIAKELMDRIAAEDLDVPRTLEEFLDRHTGDRPTQLPLRLRKTR
jgi:hypothetical protein